MTPLFANSADPDQMSHSAASDLDLHCLPITLLGVSILKWVNHQLKLQIRCKGLAVHVLYAFD